MASVWQEQQCPNCRTLLGWTQGTRLRWYCYKCGNEWYDEYQLAIAGVGCRACRGVGSTPEYTCPSCEGRGIV